MNDSLKRAADLVAARGSVVVLTGAGISVESGIPDFRSSEGLWTRFDPQEYATIDAFRRTPGKVWKMLAEMDEVLDRARPNPGHRALARLEAAGVVRGVVTQNIDGLHQAAGSRRVVEFHGSHASLTCLSCGRTFSRAQAQTRPVPPPCDCGALLKPDVVFFGEDIPSRALAESTKLVENCGVMLVVGTSAEVAPASHLPWRASQAGAQVVEVNLGPTQLTGRVTHLFLEGPASQVLPSLADAVLSRLGDSHTERTPP